MRQNSNTLDKCILGSLRLPYMREDGEEKALSELSSLLLVCGLEVVATISQSLDTVVSSTYFGSGKVEEIGDFLQKMEVDTLVVNGELSGIQLRNLEEKLGVRVIDRTMVVLDIFALHARSKEAKLQVEYAQLKYRLPRLLGFGRSLSRLGGGIGTRGPGEKKLEVDRRHIQKRLDDIRAELKALKKSHGNSKKMRLESNLPLVALVGYTNVGKSSILNKLIRLTDANGDNVYVKDELFATLDTFIRRIDIGTGHSFLLSDTVGFISNLPKQLLEAFGTTLDEVGTADLILHVIDASSENTSEQIEAVKSVLHSLGAMDKPQILVYNKMDLLAQPLALRENEIAVSAASGLGMSDLLSVIEKHIFSDFAPINLLIPYERGDLLTLALDNGTLIGDLDHNADGTALKISLNSINRGKLEKYSI